MMIDFHVFRTKKDEKTLEIVVNFDNLIIFIGILLNFNDFFMF